MIEHWEGMQVSLALALFEKSPIWLGSMLTSQSPFLSLSLGS